MTRRSPQVGRTIALLFLAAVPMIAACSPADTNTPSGAGGMGGVVGAGSGGTGTGTGTGGSIGTVGSGGATTGSGGSFGSGGATTGGGGSVGSGGSSATTGSGGSFGSGGATTGLGGRGTGGASAGSGGATSGSGGAASGSGGSTAASGGRVGTGGAASGTGGSTSVGGRGGATGAAGSTGAGGAAGGMPSGGSTGAGGAGAFTVTTPAFANQAGCGPDTAASCATFPRDNTNYGLNVSPAMTWTGAPAGTQSFAVVLQDLTNGNAHWVLWNIPATVTMLAENVPKASAMPSMPAGSQQCSIGTGDGYFGPGACGNVYEFLVYALSVQTFTPTMATNNTMVRMQLQALGTSILGTASMRARSFAPNCP